VKLYGESANTGPERKYSPGVCIGAARIGSKATRIAITFPRRTSSAATYPCGRSLRRFTRLSIGFSKKFENHCHMVALYTVWYNFVEDAQDAQDDPALAAGVADRLWSVGDIVDLIETGKRWKMAHCWWATGTIYLDDL